MWGLREIPRKMLGLDKMSELIRGKKINSDVLFGFKHVGQHTQ